MYDAARSRGATGWSLRLRAGGTIGERDEQKVDEVAVLNAVVAQHRLGDVSGDRTQRAELALACAFRGKEVRDLTVTDNPRERSSRKTMFSTTSSTSASVDAPMARRRP